MVLAEFTFAAGYSFKSKCRALLIVTVEAFGWLVAAGSTDIHEKLRNIRITIRLLNYTLANIYAF